MSYAEFINKSQMNKVNKIKKWSSRNVTKQLKKN